MVRHVLVIDDDRDFTGELKELLVLSGYSVTIVCNPRAGVETAARARPDVVLLDLKMESMSGFDVLSGLRERAETKEIPVVVISGFFSEDRDFSLLSYFNVTNYLQKPFTPLTVITQIEAAARGKGRLPV